MAHIIIDYVWLGGHSELRSKTKVIPIDFIDLAADGSNHSSGGVDLKLIPEWNYDGSSTDQATTESSEVIICPRRLFKCPFRRPNGFIVMCDTYSQDRRPLSTNHRFWANNVFEKYRDQHPWYGLEQEYFIFDPKTGTSLGFHPDDKQGRFYCSVGSKNCFGRALSDEHMAACLYAGIKISGTNSEVAPGQFEYQVGPVEGIDAADQLWISRYILEKLSENFNLQIVFHPKPYLGDWNGSGCHTNFSTAAMRTCPEGIEVIMAAIERLRLKHSEHMKVYGEDNELRMSGQHETSKYDEFSYGISNRKCSIRIPTDTAKNGGGYFEDRRPASNCDPYLVTSKILETVMNHSEQVTTV